jgi:asparaginyl-tRNA synthetase
MKRTKIYTLLHEDPNNWIGKTVHVGGWIRTVRDQKNFAFLEINDGSIFNSLQAVLESSNPSYKFIPELTTGASVYIQGVIVKSPGKNQSIELKVETLEILGSCDPATYPLQKKQHSFEFLRTIAHLRPRTNTQGAVTRVRSALAYATHKFFQERRFFYIHTPIITGSDCEGAGEMFRVTTLDPIKSKKEDVDFFGKSTFLTVSGQLNGEIYACSLGDIYTFGPTFRAEKSNTSRHLAEFWMIEPEMAFAELEDDMQLAESYVKYLIHYVLEHCKEDMQFFDKWIEKGLIERLENVLKNPFERITYTDAIGILEKATKKFEFPVFWGCDLQSEHERYLTEEHFKKPVIVRDYPEKLKAFYMRLNEDKKTVAAMDVLVPKIGELIGGSQREERLEVLEAKIEKMGLHKEDYWWYLELRKYGSVPHAGFGLGFERLVQFVTGMENIRDVIGFPRYPGHADF